MLAGTKEASFQTYARVAGFSYLAIMLVGSLANIVTPRFADLTMLSYAPGTLFELGIGAWLLIKGIKLPAS